ncbi:hydantoinase/oxoprolinase family protein [Sphingomonas canadensis]|uniref:Hydantoinase/oxoprolinase family protein n=1 Tax=Sphingomonas canadensis TaxID=1219257 RepID=A0ABW3H8D0_9SPHN|nr:hydantoinase/oxoprolinase family protein [Sphingomonas canadensis]MCW3834526.1 hydantoinase/oxoprolinase family protein [Sphingomonas canadensis]
MRFATDTGGTFTDLVVEGDDGLWRAFKASTVAEDPVRGVLDALRLAAGDYGLTLRDLLQRGDTFIHATTHAINAVLTGTVARTALLTTQGHPDILLLREGGRPDPFDFSTGFPKPYVARRDVWELPGRIDADGSVFAPLDEERVIAILDELAEQRVEAIAVCLLWSIVNPAHELRLGELIEARLPGIPYTLSHQLNPIPREYRRASAASIDASLKPMMGRYLGSLTRRLADAGFGGRVLMVTSQGGVMDAGALAKAPIHVLNSGPSMAPVAGRHFAGAMAGDAIVADTGGTTFDISVVRDGRLPLTRELWVGPPIVGHLTGFPSVDVRSVGAGGGSIGRVDRGGILHVGPQSAGAWPGPACYGRGGTEPTLTDAALVLGYLDPAFFLGGTMPLDVTASERALATIATPLGVDVTAAAAAVVELATETMAQAILQITEEQGIDPERATLVGGGGAAGMNLIFIGRRLGCPRIIVPEAGSTLSAAGALMSDLVTERRATARMSTVDFSPAAANDVLDRLQEECAAFAAAQTGDPAEADFVRTVEARYADQAWEIEVMLPAGRLEGPADVARFRQAFDAEHQRLYGFCDPASAVEIVSWRVGVACRLKNAGARRLAEIPGRLDRPARAITLPNGERHDAPVHRWSDMPVQEIFSGPAVVESFFTSVVIDHAQFHRAADGSLVIDL